MVRAGADGGPGILDRHPRPRTASATWQIIRADRAAIRISSERLPQLLRYRIQVLRAAHADPGAWDQFAWKLPGRVQLCDRLVEVDADAPDQPGSADQLGQRILEQRIWRGGLPSRGGQGGLGRVRGLGQPGSSGRLLQVSEFFLGQGKAYSAPPRVALAGPTT
jgi:hypothetical protein